MYEGRHFKIALGGFLQLALTTALTATIMMQTRVSTIGETMRINFVSPVLRRIVCLLSIGLLGLTCSPGNSTAQDLSSEPQAFVDQKDSEATTELEDDVLTLEDVFELEYASDPQISPDGKTVVFVRNSFDIMKDRRVSRIWQIQDDSIRPLISDIDSSNSPRWSPDGSRLAYVSTNSGSNQIHCFWMDDQKTIPLTRLTESPGNLSWSPDGKWLAFTMRVPGKKKPFAELPKKPEGAEWADSPVMITKLRYRSDGAGYLPEGYRQIFMVSAKGGTPRQLTHGEYNHGGGLSWTSDSKSILFSGNLRPDADYQPSNSEIYRLDIQDRKLTQLTDRVGPDASPTISPDGKWIAYTGYDDKLLGNQSSSLYLMNTESGESKILVGDLDRSIQSPTWNSSSTGVYFQYDDFGNTKIAFTDLNGRGTEMVADVGGTSLGRPYSSGSFSVADNGTIAYTRSQPTRPADVAIRKDKTTRTVTSLNEDLFAFKNVADVEEIRFESSHDQLALQGWIVKPPKMETGKKYPLILEIHGGPFANYGPRFAAEMQLYAAAGYVVFYMNPRGSTSYGQEFANKIHHNYPGNDYEDLMSGVDAVIEKGYVDSERLYVTGGSGGGVLTAWIIGKTDRFKAAVVAKPVINWYSFALTADMYNYFYKYWFPGLPWDHQDEYMKRSPISLVGNVKTPTMLLTGTADYRTPISESEQYYQALKLMKVDTALVRIPGASHGIASRPSRLAAKVAYVLKWFETHK